MAQRDTNLNINVTATDKASPTIDRVQADVKALEGEHDIGLGVDDKATDDLADIRDKLDALTDKDREIVLKGKAQQLEGEIRKAERSLKDIEKFDGDEIRVRLEARDNASKKLDAVRSELRSLDGDVATVRVEGLDGGGGGLGGGVGAGAGVAGVAAALATGLGAAADNAADTAIQVQAISNRSGASLEQVSRLAALFKDNGTEASDLADILSNVNGVLRDNPELAEQLGIKIDKSTTSVDLFLQAVKGVETGFDDVGQAGVVASQLFGEEGVRQVDIVTASVGDLETAMAGVDEHRVYTNDDVQAARDITTEIAKQRGHLEAIGIAVLPIFTTLLGLAEHLTGQATADAIIGVWGRGGIIPNALGNAAHAVLGRPNPGEEAVIARNTGGFHPLSLTPPPSTRQGPIITIINPPGTPASTVDAGRVYQRRNGTGVSYS